MMPNMKLIISIINYLKEEAKKEIMNADTQESLEVAVQCLQTAYDLDPKDPRLTSQETLSLEDIFLSALPSSEDEAEEAAGGTLKKAEIMKNLGNNLMRNNHFHEAIRHYTAAIEIDSNNAVYYCNRAAAYSKLNEFQNAIADCEKAVQIDPLYAKAYGRMGLAYTSLNQGDLAVKAFQKAVEIEPENESYQNNLKLAKEKKEKPQVPMAGLAGLNSVDWQSLFSNPAFRNMASSIMQDPNIINAAGGMNLSMLSSGLSSSLNQAASASTFGDAAGDSDGPNVNTSSPTGGGINSLDVLLEAGQYLAAQMQAANPDLMEQVRQRRNMNPPNPDNKDSSTQ